MVPKEKKGTILKRVDANATFPLTTPLEIPILFRRR